MFDQLTKAWAVAGLVDGPASIIGTTVELQLTRNPGGAFSLFQWATPLLALLALVVAIVLARAIARTDDRLMLVSLSLVLGGALGNLCDRFFRSPGFLRGQVVDFVSVGLVPHVQRRRLRASRSARSCSSCVCGAGPNRDPG